MTTNTLSGAWGSKPVARVAAPLREQVIVALREAILDFHLKPGQRLIERELIEQLGVSRTTVREALRELTSEGLVTVVPQKGAIISAPSAAEAADLYEVRAMLEGLLVQRFVERASDDQVDALARAVEGFAEVAAQTDDIRLILNAKDVFYEVLVSGAASQALQGLVEGIQARVRILRATSLSESGRASAAVGELRGILAAIQARDGLTAARLCTEHVKSAARTAVQHLN